MNNVKFKRLIDGAIIPTKGTPKSAGFDLYVPTDVTIHKGRQIVPLGFAIELPQGTFATVKSRSGFASKGMEAVHSIMNGFTQESFKSNFRADADVLNGTIDEDYRGSVGVIINSHDKQDFVIEKGTRIAQMIIQPYVNAEFEEVEELSDTERGEGGFGHTGV